MRLLLLLLPALLLAGCAGADDPDAGPAPTSEAPAGETPAGEPPASEAPTRPGAGPSGQPPRDTETITRTGPLPLDFCTDGAPAYSFDGTVVAADGGVATFEVHESFLGDVPASIEVRLGEPVTSTASESPPSWSIGTRLLVQGAGGRAWGCGDTVYHDEASVAEWRS